MVNKTARLNELVAISVLTKPEAGEELSVVKTNLLHVLRQDDHAQLYVGKIFTVATVIEAHNGETFLCSGDFS